MFKVFTYQKRDLNKFLTICVTDFVFFFFTDLICPGFIKPGKKMTALYFTQNYYWKIRMKQRLPIISVAPVADIVMKRLMKLILSI